MSGKMMIGVYMGLDMIGVKRERMHPVVSEVVKGG